VDIPIPEDQLARIRPVVDELLTKIRALTAQLPDESDSAVDYSPTGEND
jgi:hypothetical protein